MSGTGIKTKELGQVISWEELEITISDGKISKLNGDLVQSINSDLDGFITFSKKVKEVINAQTPRKVRKDKNISRKTTLIGSNEKDS